MTTQKVEFEFGITGLTNTDDGITKLTGSLTGLEKLAKSFDSGGVKKLETLVKDLSKSFVGLRADLAGISTSMSQVSTNMGTAVDKISSALDRIGKAGTASNRKIDEAAQAAKTLSSEVQGAKKSLDTLDKSVSGGTKTKKIKVEVDAKEAEGILAAIELKTHQMDKLRTTKPQQYLDRMYSARMDRMAKTSDGGRMFSHEQMKLLHGETITHDVDNIKRFDKVVASISASVEGTRRLAKGFADAEREASTLAKTSRAIRLNSAQASGTAALKQFDAERKGDLTAEYLQANKLKQYQDYLRKARVAATMLDDKGNRVYDDRELSAMFGKKTARTASRSISFHAADSALTGKLQQLEDDAARLKAELAEAKHMKSLWIANNAKKQREAEQALARQTQVNEAIRLNSAKASGTATIRQFNSEREGDASSEYLRQSNLSNYLKKLQKARVFATQQDDNGNLMYNHQEIAAKFGRKVADIVSSSDKYTATVHAVTTKLEELKAAEAQLVAQVKFEADQKKAWIKYNADKYRAASAQPAPAVDRTAEKLNSQGVNAELSTRAAQLLSPNRYLSRLQNAKSDYDSGLLNQQQFSAKWGNSLQGLVSNGAAYTAELNKVKAAVASAEEAHLRFGKSGHDMFRGLTSGVGMIWLSWGQIIPMLSGFAMSAGVRAMIQAGSQFEHQMKIIGALSQETSASLGAVGDSLLRSSSGSMFALNDMVGGLKALTQAGFSTKDAMQNLGTVMNLSLLGETSPEQSALFLAGIRNTFKNDPTISDNNGNVDLTQAANITAIAAAKSQTSIQEMMESMKQASSVADVYGLRLTDVSVALQLLAERNITGSAAGTAVRNAMEDLTGRTDKARKALQQLGVSLYDSKTGTTRNAFDVMSDIREKMAGFSDMKRNRFIQSFTDERGKKLIEAFLAKSDSEIREMRAQTFRASENGGFVTRGAEDINTSLQALSGQALNTFRASAVDTFKEINPGLKELMTNLKQLAGSPEMRSGLSALANGFVTIARAGVGAVSLLAKFGPALAGLAGGAAAAKGLSVLFSGLQKLQALSAAGTLFPRLVAPLAMLLTPMGALTAALMAGGAAWMYFASKGDEAAGRLRSAKDRLDELSTSMSNIRTDSYSKFNQSEQGSGASIGESIDHSLNQQLVKIDGQKTALQNLSSIQQEFKNRQAEAGKAASEDDLEREMFLVERRRSFLKQQLDEYVQFLRAKGIKDDESRKLQQTYADQIKSADDQYYNYQLQLSQLRIEQTKKEVIERNKWYKLLGYDKAGDEAIMAGPAEWVNKGFGRASVAAVSSKLDALARDQAAGKDINGQLPALEVELKSYIEKVGEVVSNNTSKLKDAEGERSTFLKNYMARNGGKEPPANNGYLANLNGNVSYYQRTLGEAQRLQRALQDRLTIGGTGTTVSIESLRAYQNRKNEEQRTKAAEPRPTDTNVADLERGSHKGTSLLSLVDEYSGEDRGVSKLLQALKSGAGTDDYKTQLDEYTKLLSQDGASGDFARAAGSFESYRARLTQFINEHKTLQARLDRSLDGLIQGVKDDTARLNENPVPDGASDTFKDVIAAREKALKDFDKERIAALKAEKNPDNHKAINEQFKRRLAQLENAIDDNALALIDSRRREIIRSTKQSNKKELEQKQIEVSDKLYDLNKPLETFNSYLNDLNTSAKSLIKTWVETDFGSISSIYDSLRKSASLYRGPAEYRLDDTLNGLDRKRNQALQATTREAEDKFGTEGVTDPEQYKKLLEAQQAYIRTRSAAINDMYQMEVDLARASYEKQSSFAYQYQKSFTDYYTQMQTPAQTFGETMTKGLNQLQTAFYNMGKGAKVTFWDIKNGFRELVKDMIAQMIAKKMMEATMGVISGAASLAMSGIGAAMSYFSPPAAPGFTSGTLGSGLTPGSSGIGVSPNSGPGLQLPMSMRAAGGAVSAGVPYTVGEQGWEVFVPNTDGYIVPNQVARNATAGGGSGGDYNITIVINDNSTSESTTQGGVDSSAGPDIAQQIKAKVMEVLLEQKRPGGVLSR